MNRNLAYMLLAAGSLALALHAPAAMAQEKIDGKIVSTKLTHCNMDVKIGGCAGTFAMESTVAGKKEELMFEVPLGTPITRGSETMYLPALRGKTVVVTAVTEKNQRVAKAIEVPK